MSHWHLIHFCWFNLRTGVCTSPANTDVIGDMLNRSTLVRFKPQEIESTKVRDKAVINHCCYYNYRHHCSFIWYKTIYIYHAANNFLHGSSFIVQFGFVGSPTFNLMELKKMQNVICLDFFPIILALLWLALERDN